MPFISINADRRCNPCKNVDSLSSDAGSGKAGFGVGVAFAVDLTAEAVGFAAVRFAGLAGGVS